MRMLLRASLMVLAGCMAAPALTIWAQAAEDDARGVGRPAQAKQATVGAPSANKAENALPALNLLDAVKHGQVAVEVQGRNDGRVTVSVTNRTRKPLRVVLPPGIIAQGATGQMGGMMGGMGGGMGG